MSLHYVIDAYNLIRRTSALQKSNQISSLINFILNDRPQGSLRNRVTLVFDGHPKLDFRVSNYPNIEVIFSRDLSADTVIKNIVKKFCGNKNLIIVSDDREIIDNARMAGVSNVSTTEFVKKKRRENKSLVDSCEHKFLSYTQMSKINKELKEVWLKKSK